MTLLELCGTSQQMFSGTVLLLQACAGPCTADPSCTSPHACGAHDSTHLTDSPAHGARVHHQVNFRPDPLLVYVKSEGVATLCAPMIILNGPTIHHCVASKAPMAQGPHSANNVQHTLTALHKAMLQVTFQSTYDLSQFSSCPR